MHFQPHCLEQLPALVLSREYQVLHRGKINTLKWELPKWALTLLTMEKHRLPQDSTSTCHLLFLRVRDGEVTTGLIISLLSGQPHLSYIHANNAMYCVHTTTFRDMSKSRNNGCGFGISEFSRSLAIKLPLFYESDYHWKSSEFNPPNNTVLNIYIFWLMQKNLLL